MSAPNSTLETAIESLLRRIVREEIHQVFSNGYKSKETKKPYLTIKEAAEVSRLAPSTIRLAIRKRELRSLKAGSRVIIKREDLESYLEANPLEAKAR
jgi:excisionase family DNA binding protein